MCVLCVYVCLCGVVVGKVMFAVAVATILRSVLVAATAVAA